MTGAKMRYARRGGAIIGVIVLVWLLIGVLAAWQRGYFKTGETSCATAGTIALTVITGPLTYAGVNPKVTHSNTTVVIFLEGMEPLGNDAHRYYDSLIRQLEDDPKHVQHIQNVWGDALTAAAAQSIDGKAAYVQLSLAGQQGETLANESVEAVRNVVMRTPALPGVKAWVIGPCHSLQGEAAWERHFAGRAPGQ
jgi:putative drug exporter of the RND superfamily